MQFLHLQVLHHHQAAALVPGQGQQGEKRKRQGEERKRQGEERKRQGEERKRQGVPRRSPGSLNYRCRCREGVRRAMSVAPRALISTPALRLLLLPLCARLPLCLLPVHDGTPLGR
jgi:hypothetical protein